MTGVVVANTTTILLGDNIKWFVKGLEGSFQEKSFSSSGIVGFTHSSKTECLNRIVELATKNYPDSEIYLYGSRACGNARSISDWDLLVLLNSKKVSFNIETKLMDEFYELELETGEIISPLIYSKIDWNKNHSITPLYKNILKEGVKIK